jgi:hypothetical protein
MATFSLCDVVTVYFLTVAAPAEMAATVERARRVNAIATVDPTR